MRGDQPGGTRDHPRLTHWPALDGLRGAAVLAVIAFHLGHLRGGFLGVDLFFSLSGFLITSLLIVEHERTGRIALGPFWTRRAKRLLPAAVAVIVVCAAGAAWFGTAAETRIVRSDSLWGLAYLANWHSLAAGHGYWATFAVPSPLGHLWSLAIEEQFYVVWPVVALVLLRLGGVKRLVQGALVLGAASAAAMVVQYSPANPSRVYQGTDTRAAALLLGAVLSGAVAHGRRTHGNGRRALELVALVAAGGIALAWVVVSGADPHLYRGGFVLLGVAALPVVAAATDPAPGLVAHLFAWAPLRLAGRVSYGLYLWHVPVITWLRLRGWHGTRLDLAALAATAVLTALSYHLLEWPLRRLAVRPRRARRVVPTALALAAVAVLVLTEAHPVPTVVAAPPRRVLAAAAVSEPATAAVPTVIMVVGDSVADVLATGMQKAAPPGTTIIDAGIRGCGIGRARTVRIFGTTADRSQCWSWDARWAALIARTHPQVVVGITGPWDRADWQLPGDSAFTSVADPEHELWLAGEYRAAAQLLASGGAEVRWLHTPCLRPRFPGPDPFGDPERAAAIDHMLAGLATEGRLRMMDLPAYPCGDPDVQPDGIHWDPAVAEQMGAQILYELQATPLAPPPPPSAPLPPDPGGQSVRARR